MGGSTSKSVEGLEKGDCSKEKSSNGTISTSSSTWFPDELVIDILKRVDDGSCIVRLRCLSKSWCRILSRPSFIHSFLCSDYPNDRRRRIIVMRTRVHRPRWRNEVINGRPRRILRGALFKYNFDYTPSEDGDGDDNNVRGMTYSLLSYDTLREQRVSDGDDDGHLVQVAANPPPPLLPPEVVINIDPNNSVIIGSCDGILCIGSRKKGSEAASDLILWNPTTGEAKLLPSIPSIPTHPPPLNPFLPPVSIIDEYFGFSFDSKTSDYKIVAILTLTSSRRFSVDENRYHNQFSYSSKFPWIRTWVYSLRDDKWREFRISNNMIINNSPLPFVAGDYKLLVKNDNNITSWWHCCDMCTKCYIMSFDMSKQEFELETFGMHNDWVAQCCLQAGPLAMGMLKNKSILAIFDMFGWFNDSFCRYYELWGILDYKKMVNENSSSSSSSSSSGNWVKLFSFDGDLMRPLVSSNTLPYMSCLPGIWKDGYYFSIGNKGELNLFDPETKQFKHLQIGHGDNDWPIFGIVAYIPSSNSLSGFKHIDGMSFLNWFNF